MNIDQLMRIMPSAKRAAEFLAPLNDAMLEFGIITGRDQAAFLANVGHESGQLNSVEEILNYSVDRLMVVWPKRFPTVGSAVPYARNPEALANKVYANRGGNGDEASGDGFRYCGASLIQITFHDNHKACADHFGMPLDSMHAWLRTPGGASRSAGWFWQSHGLSEIVEFDKICDMINIGHETEKVGDSIGYSDRLTMYSRGLAAL